MKISVLLPYVAHTIHKTGNVLATDTHERAVDKIAIIPELQLANHNTLLRGHHVQAGARAADHAWRVVWSIQIQLLLRSKHTSHFFKNGITGSLFLEQLHVRVEQVSLRHVDALKDTLVSCGCLFGGGAGWCKP